MAEWCADNLRSTSAWKSEGLDLSTPSDEAAKLFDGSLRQMVSWMDCEQLGGLENTMNKMLEADPEMIMGRTFAVGMSLDKNSSQKLVLDAKNFGTPREQKHAIAMDYFVNGQTMNACYEWDKILAEYPTDLFALRFSFEGHYMLGKFYDNCATFGRVIEHWKPSMPGYSFLLSTYALNLEECGQIEKSEQMARKALEIQPHDCWAVHAIAHCMETTGRYKEGIQFMESTKTAWEPCNMLACHNHWHNALFYVDGADYESALSIYDNEIDRRCKARPHLNDAASLLARLEMEGVNVGDRWNKLLPIASNNLNNHVWSFSDAHISIVLSRTDEDFIKQHQNSISSFISTGSGDQQNIFKLVGEEVCLAVADFNKERYVDCVNKLYPIRHLIKTLGGSHAQRDVFIQFLIHAAIRSKQYRKAMSLIEERNQIMINSPLSTRLAVHQRDHINQDIYK
uniref:Tetratricopeptide repeat protein 38 n=1 Tax=Acrobeloides nanus TaxID=290746 RepID=A0A914CKS5_9BILA